MDVYISGKISGLNIIDVLKKFNEATKRLYEKGYVPFNPIELRPIIGNKTWKDYMIKDIEVLFGCDAIYMLKDWGMSRGARIEYAIAKELNLKIFFEDELFP